MAARRPWLAACWAALHASQTCSIGVAHVGSAVQQAAAPGRPRLWVRNQLGRRQSRFEQVQRLRSGRRSVYRAPRRAAGEPQSVVRHLIESSMSSSRQTFFGEFLTHRSSVLELLLVAVVIGTSVGLLCSAVPQLLELTPAASALVGAALLTVSVSYLFARIVSLSERQARYNGFIACDPKSSEIINVPRYHVSRNLREYLRSSFIENPTLKRHWSVDLGNVHLPPEEEEGEKARRAAALLREAVEYYALHELSVHLSDYANQLGEHESAFVTLERTSLPDVLLTNRFMELFTKQPDQRAIFSREHEFTGPGKVVAIYDAAGGLFEHFELALPRHSRVRRISENSVEIATPRAVITLAVSFDGFGYALPPGLAAHLLKRADPRDIHCFGIGIELSCKFKVLRLLSRKGWRYYEWIDSFLRSLETKFSAEAYFHRIGWDFALTMIETRDAQQANGAAAPPT